MAMGMAPGGGSRRRGRRGRRGVIAEINVTPLVDVMLVLLIIFMVTAPLMNAGVPVDLPDSRANPLPQQPRQVTISLAADGKTYLDEAEVAPGELAELGIRSVGAILGVDLTPWLLLSAPILAEV